MSESVYKWRFLFTATKTALFAYDENKSIQIVIKRIFSIPWELYFYSSGRLLRISLKSKNLNFGQR